MRSIRGVDVRGKRVLVRVDYNVPLTGSGEVADPSRIVESLPTIHYLRGNGGRTVLMSHLGRPKGRDANLSLRPVARELERQVGAPVLFASDTVGSRTEAMVRDLQDGGILLLENLRFDPGEEKNDPAYADALARLGDLFVEDAFGSVHRAHASTVGVADRLPAYAGFLVENEVRELGKLLVSPEKPFAAMLGGAKVTDKLPLLKSLLGHVDRLLIGGAMALPLMEPGTIEDGALRGEVEGFLSQARTSQAELVLPVDFVLSRVSDGRILENLGGKVPEGCLALDIGRESRKVFSKALSGTRTVFFNGALGKAEDPRFAGGTREVLEALQRTPGTHVLAGGDTARIVRDMGLEGGFTYISTGGGAALEFIEGRDLPGLAVIP